MNYPNWSQRQWWSAGDIAAALGKKRGTVYHHLRVVREQKGAEYLPPRFPLTAPEAQTLAGFITCKTRKKKID